LRLLKADPIRAREALLASMGRLVLTPTTDGYRLTGAFNLTIALYTKTPEVSTSEVSGKSGSGGRICATYKVFEEVSIRPVV
jgi:hypothetical protein